MYPPRPARGGSCLRCYPHADPLARPVGRRARRSQRLTRRLRATQRLARAWRTLILSGGMRRCNVHAVHIRMRRERRSAPAAVPGSGSAPIAPHQRQRQPKDTPSQMVLRPRFTRSREHGARTGRCPRPPAQMTDRPGSRRRCGRPVRRVLPALRLRTCLQMPMSPGCAACLPARMTGPHNRHPLCHATFRGRQRYGPPEAMGTRRRALRRSHAHLRETLARCHSIISATPRRAAGRIRHRRRTRLKYQAGQACLIASGSSMRRHHLGHPPLAALRGGHPISPHIHRTQTRDTSLLPRAFPACRHRMLPQARMRPIWVWCHSRGEICRPQVSSGRCSRRRLARARCSRVGATG